MASEQTEDTPELKKIIESALDTAVMVIHLGGSTSMADHAFKNITGKCSISHFNIMWRLDNILVNYDVGGQTKTLLKSIGSVGTNLTAVSKVIELSENVKDGRIAVAEVDDGLKQIAVSPPIHSRLIFILVAGLAAAFYSLFHHGSIASVLTVFAAAVIGQTVRLQLQAKDFRDSHISFICGLISAAVTSIILHLGYGQLEIQTLIACLIYLVPGLLMINGFVDFTKQRYLFIGIQRMINAFFIFLILSVVILIAFTFIKV